MTNLNDEQALVGRTGMELVWGRIIVWGGVDVGQGRRGRSI